MRLSPPAKFLARAYDAVVPIYVIRCPEHGQQEVFRSSMAVLRDGNAAFDCEIVPGCPESVQQLITPECLPHARIDSAGEDCRIPERVADGTAAFNMGLPGVETVVGTRKSYDPNLNGKPRLEYRPLTHHEVSSNRKARELAKKAGLEPMTSAYRPLVSK